MSVSVVISTYNRRKTFARTLTEVLDQAAGDTFDVLVVDDCSSDDTPQYMNRMMQEHPELGYLRHAENQGRVATRNDGVTAARGDIVILLDDDIVPVPGFVAAHRRVHEQAVAEHVAVMGNVWFATECVEGSNFGRYVQSRYLGCRSLRERAGIDYENLPARFFGTGNCSVRRSDLIAVGLFDARFRYYGGEDEDMGHSLRCAGVRIVFGPDAGGIHHDEVSLDRYKAKLMECARYALATTRAKSPEYVETTQVVYLLPINRQRDSASRVARKLVIGLLCKPPISRVLEWWATHIDHVPRLYSQSLYRLLTASWVYRGYRQTGDPDRRVEYSESLNHHS
jgi:glycosyltransferase involved in cell wall biosynthesis